MRTTSRAILRVVVVVLVVLGLARAAAFKFREAEDAFRAASREEMKKQGLTTSAAKAKYPTPYISAVSGGCMLPGGTAEVVVKGKFAPGTRFFFENDNVEVVKENLAAAEYRATVKAAPGIGPQRADVLAIAPVSSITTHHPNAVVITGKFEWTMEAANGWKVVARPVAEAASATCAAQPERKLKYEVQFYRPGEAAPFEKRSADLNHSMWQRANYSFSISDQDANDDAAASNMLAMAQKLSDPKLTPAQRQKVMQELQQAQVALQADLAKKMDPAYAKAQQEKKEQFGCRYIELELPGGGGRFTGQMRCAQKVGTSIKLTGSMKSL